MAEVSRAERVGAAFVEIANQLVADYDVLEFLQTLVEESVRVLDVAAAGVLLADPNGELQVMASTSERTDLVEILQLRAGAGPCVECYLTGHAVSVDDIRFLTGAWEAFKTAALSQGFHSVHAVPMRVRGKTVGAMGLFGDGVGPLTPEDAALGQALADIATIGLLQERAIRETNILNEQLQRASNSRVLVEQAKGVIAYTAKVDMDEAFTLLRNYSRRHHKSLHETAAEVTERTLTL